MPGLANHRSKFQGVRDVEHQGQTTPLPLESKGLAQSEKNEAENKAKRETLQAEDDPNLVSTHWASSPGDASNSISRLSGQMGT